MKQETVSGSGISWAICKSAPRSRWITMPAPHHSVSTGRMPFLPRNQQCQSTEGTSYRTANDTAIISASIRQILKRNTVLPLISAHLNVYQMQFYCDKLPNNKCIGPQAAGRKCIRPRWTLVLPP